jgi:hypothetical protein
VAQKSPSVKSTITRFQTSTEKFSGRAGLSLISRYLESIGITDRLASQFSFLKKNGKGTTLKSFFHQIICFFFDGTDFHMSRFDHLKEDGGYAGVIETPGEQMLSSHSAKRLFGSMSVVRVWLLRKVLKQLFLWRLSIEQPEVIKLGIDTMVMDNDDALKREGVEPTYKKVKGFQPLQVYWGRYLIDAIFRNGKAHSNHGNHVVRVVSDLVRLIRREYRDDIPIIFVADTGFFDQQLFYHCEQLKVGLIVGGKMYQDIRPIISETEPEYYTTFSKGRQQWLYTEFGDRRKTWDRFFRTIFTKPLTEEDGQIIFEFDRPETLIYTNIGMNTAITAQLAEKEPEFISAESIICTYHERARDELVNRALKNFGTEHLPFKRFSSNAFYYYMMCISFFLFESFKHDIDSPAVPVTWYAESFRRKLLDFAGQIVHSGRQIILKLPEVISKALNFNHLWSSSGDGPPLLPWKSA